MILQVYVDERTYRALWRVAERTGRSIEELAEAAVSNETSKTREWHEVLPPGHPERSLDATLESALHLSGYRR